MKPNCYNHPPPPPGSWSHQPPIPNRKPRWRWIPYRMSRICGTWRAPEGSTPYPLLNGWNCAGCRWKPRNEDGKPPQEEPA